jgi:hypothetical protein
MKMMLSDHDLEILLYGTLMNWGYPFRFAHRYRLDASEEEMINSVDGRFVAMRRENHEKGILLARQVELLPHEASSLIAILEACLAECRGNSISIHLHLHAEDENEVRLLIDRLSQVTVQPDHYVQ